MLGLVQERSLLISDLIGFAERNHRETEIISRRAEDNALHRTTWGSVADRARRLALALDALRVPKGARVATLAWNSYRHLECYFGVSGSQRIVHTLNPRLHDDQLVWIANHAEDFVFIFDTTFLPVVRKIHEKIPSIRHWVCFYFVMPFHSSFSSFSHLLLRVLEVGKV